VSRAWRETQASAVTGGSPNGRTARADRPRAVRDTILDAARTCLLEEGYGRLSTRRVAESAGVPLSQIHYHFGSKQQLVLQLLAAENVRLLDRQARMYSGPEPLSVQWDTAVGYLDADLASGYVRVLQELVAAGWSDAALAASLRELLGAWMRLLTDVARRTAERHGRLGPFTPEEAGALMALPFVGVEPMLLLGFEESEFPARAALRKVGDVIRGFETAHPASPPDPAGG
jgi:AcrR family transcriptional regulator